jgi:hypothetical protein
MAEPGPRAERSPYQGASILFASVLILFALGGIAKTLLSGDGVGSAGFLICFVFLLLGLGRLYLGMRPEVGPDGGEGTAPEAERPSAAAPGHVRPAPGTQATRRPPLRRRRP